MMRRGNWAKAFRVLALAAGVSWLVGSALTAVAADSVVINGCVKKSTGVLRILLAPGETCGKGETALSWYQMGQGGTPLVSFDELDGLLCTNNRVAGTIEISYNSAGVATATCVPSSPPNTICTPGSAYSCYSGPSGTENVGACASGTKICNAAGSGYGPCTGETLPSPEVCDGRDNDCNGATDDNLSPPAFCTNGGSCANGNWQCF